MFAERIKQLRKEQKKTQQEVADYLQVKRSTIGEYERGKIVPPFAKIEALAEFYGVSVSSLTGGGNSGVDVLEVVLEVIESLEDTRQKMIYNGETMNDIARKVLAIQLRSAVHIIKLQGSE